jgi:hypothetical protein
LVLEVAGEEIRIPSLGLTLGEPLSLVWCTTSKDQEVEQGYNLLDAEPSAAMVFNRSLVSKVSEQWTLLEPLNVWAHWRPRDSALVVSHSEGALVYVVHPILWSDEPNQGTDPRLVVGVLTERLGPEHRAPADVPVITSHLAPCETGQTLNRPRGGSA